MKYGNAPIDPALGIRPNLHKWLDEARDMRFDADSPKAAASWQRKARRQWDKLLGDKPDAVPLNPTVLEETRFDGYRRLTLTLDTAPHIKALCWYCIPDGVSDDSPSPAMIATPGHGMGAKDLLAMDVTGKPRTEGEGYQKDYALQAVRLGYPTLVVEPLGFGERRDEDMMAGKSGESGCHAAFSMALMLGTSLARLRVNDLQRAIDYLETRPEINAKRIGLMGISGGGQMTLWTTALEKRISAAIVSGYINRFKHSVMGMNHCICNFVPGAAKYFDMPDLAALIAPRPLLIESGTEDPIFPIKATRSAIREIKSTYGVWDAKGNVDSDVFEADHQWSGAKLANFLKKHL